MRACVRVRTCMRACVVLVCNAESRRKFGNSVALTAVSPKVMLYFFHCFCCCHCVCGLIVESLFCGVIICLDRESCIVTLL